MTSLLNEVDNFPGVGEEYLLKIWKQISPDPNIILQIPESFFTNKVKKEKILKKRKRNIGRNLSISYQEPLHMLEAKDQYFYDENGRKYLEFNIFKEGSSLLNVAVNLPSNLSG